MKQKPKYRSNVVARGVARRAGLIVLVLSVCWPLMANAQRPGRGGDPLERWMRSQRDTWDQVTGLSFVEAINWSVDSPFGTRNVEAVVEVTGMPMAPDARRRVVSARVNGRRASRRDLQQADNVWRAARVRSNDFQALRDVAPRFLAGMRPAAPPSPVAENGRTFIRLELVPRASRSAIERITLWFTPEFERLVRSRAIVRPQAARSNFVIATEYRRVAGLDVPAVRSIEGSYQTRRRAREFTSLIVYNTAYSDYQFTLEQ